MRRLRWPKTTSRGWRHGVLTAVAGAVVVVGSLAVPSSAVATNDLLNGEVDPRVATSTTVVTFRVDYVSSQPPRAATAIWADVVRITDGATAIVGLSLASGGNSTNGTWTGSSTFTAGEWQVTFRAQAAQGATVPDLDGGTLVVTGETSPPTPAPTPSPPPSPAPTPSPPPSPAPATPRPTAAPSPTSAPRTATPLPTPTSSAERSVAPFPTSTSSPGGAPGARPSSDTPSATASASIRPDDGSIDRIEPSASPGPSPDGDEADEGERRGLRSVLPWLAVGGGLSTIGAALLARQWIAVRRRSG